MVSMKAAQATIEAEHRAKASEIDEGTMQAVKAARLQRDSQLSAAGKLATAARNAAEKEFQAVQKSADKRAASENVLIKRSEMNGVKRASEEWHVAREKARTAETTSFEEAQDKMHSSMKQAQQKLKNELKVAEQQHRQSIKAAEESRLHVLTSTSREEAQTKAAAARAKADALAEIRAGSTLPDSSISFLAVAEEKMSIQEATAAATARQKKADADARAHADDEASRAQKRALAARQKIEERQRTNIKEVEDKFESSKKKATDKMRNTKSEALANQAAQMKKLAEQRDNAKIKIDKETVALLEGVETRLKGELADNKQHNVKAQELAKSEFHDAKVLARQEAEHAAELASKQEKQDIQKAQQRKQEQMTEIAQSGVEEAADGAMQRAPLELIQLGEEPESTIMTSAELARQQERERNEDEQRADQMIEESKQSTEQVLMSKKIEDLKLAETAAVNDATEKAKAAIAAADARELKSHQEADDAYMNVEEAAEIKFREAKQRIGQKAAQLKIQATVKKNEEYNKASKVWELKKKQARSEQLESFKQIESEEKNAIAQQKADRDAREDAAAAKTQEAVQSIQEKKKQQLSVVEQQADQGLSKLAQQTLHAQQDLVAQAAGVNTPA